MKRLASVLLTSIVGAACGADPGFHSVDASLDGAQMPDAGSGQDSAVPGDASSPDANVTGLFAPTGFVAGEQLATTTQSVSLTASTPTVFRVEASPSEHIGFFLRFANTTAKVVLYVDRYDGTAAKPLFSTNGGLGIRTLAIFDPGLPRTYWVRIVTTDPTFTGTLDVVRTPFADGATCTGDCDRLLQLPVPLDPAFDGYAQTPSTILRYQFGRRDLLMFVRHAGQTMAELGYAPFYPEDFSQWDGQTPGTDVGSPRHASHQRGKDVDLSLYGTDGRAVWRSFCTTTVTVDGRECVAGTRMGLDGYANAVMYGAILGSGRVTMSFLDRELIPAVATGASDASADGLVATSLVPLYSDGVHLMHWPNHDNHIHVRVSETTYASGFRSTPEAFEAP